MQVRSTYVGASASKDVGIAPMLLSGAHALWADGDRLAGRNWFAAAYRLAESAADMEAMAWSALGLSGLWLHEYRAGPEGVLVDARLRRALAGVAAPSSLELRLRARVDGEADYRTGEHAAVLAVVEQARQAGDPIALVEAASLAHQCLQGPEHSQLRRG